MADGSNDPDLKDAFMAQLEETHRKIARLGCYLTTINLAEPITQQQITGLLQHTLVEEKDAEKSVGLPCSALTKSADAR
jgi:ferritin-like metal-binding protein YciE